LAAAPKLLVVNADDFGFTRDVNAGIVEGYRRGILTATSIMANGAAFEDAVKLALENPGLDVGCHLVLTQGESVAKPGTPLPATLGGLLVTLALGRMAVYEELAAQVRRIVAAGLRPTHLDTHKHTHVLPSVLATVARISKEFGIPWVRRPFDIPMRAGLAAIPWSVRITSRLLAMPRKRFDAVVASHGCRTTDHFAGFRLTGRFRTPELAGLIGQLPQGATEFMCHPGRCGVELRAAGTRLKESREAELQALTAAETRQALDAAGVKLTNYRELLRLAGAG
jgi:chitin disaccharide deacetylase